MIRAPFIASMLAVACLAADSAGAYLVAMSLSLDDLAREADFVAKVTVFDSEPVVDPWFDGVAGYQPVQTRLQVLTTYKGDAGGSAIGFRHFPEGPDLQYVPQRYRFERGRTYVVFASATNEPGVFRQLWKSHRTQEDQGVVLAATTDPRTGRSIKDVVFAELTELLKSPTRADVQYGLAHLDWLSGGMWGYQQDFDRAEVLAYVVPLLSHSDNDVALAAAKMMGSHNPYMAADDAQRWLVPDERGRVPVPGFATKDGTRVNPGGKLYWQELAAVADGPGPASLRAFAIRALGHAEEPAILPRVLTWTKDPEPLVRQAAAVLLADFKTEIDAAPLTRLANDAQPEVRIGAAQAVGFGQFKELIPALGKMLGDASPAVQSAAAMSLLSFSPRDSGGVLRAHVDNREFHALFVNALARDDTEAYVDELGEIIKKQKSPEHFWGGAIPWAVSWDRLFYYVQRQPEAQVRGGGFDKVLDLLEYPATGDPAGPHYFGSTEPVALYALYVQRGMTERAAKFRALTKKNVVGDLGEFFDRAERNPQAFQLQ